MAVKNISIEKIYHVYKPHMKLYYDKYFLQHGNALKWTNTPIYQFALDLVAKGKKEVLKDLDNHIFVRYEYDYYKNEQTVKDDTHKFTLVKRMYSLIKSIKKHGYGQGKFSDKRHFINVRKGYNSIYGRGTDGYTLWTRKHRLSVCAALGIKTIKVKVFNN